MDEGRIEMILDEAAVELSDIGDQIEEVRKGVFSAGTKREMIAWSYLADAGLARCIGNLNDIIKSLSEHSGTETPLIKTESKAFA